MAARVVADVPGAPGRLRFAHALIRDTLYDGLTAARRVRLHRRAVEVLEPLYGADPSPHLAELAHHCDRRRRRRRRPRATPGAPATARSRCSPTRRPRACTDGARRARRSRIRRRARRAASSCSRSATPGRRRATRRRAQARVPRGGRASRGASGCPQALARAAAELRRADHLGARGRRRTALPLLEEALAGLAGEDVALRVRLLARLAAALRDEPSRDRRDALSRDAVELARRIGDPAALAYALDGRGSPILAPDTVAEVEALGAELRDLATRIGDRERRHGPCTGSARCSCSGRWRRRRPRSRSATGSPASSGSPHTLGRRRGEGDARPGGGQAGDAEGLMADPRALGERAQPEMAIPVHLVQRYTLCDFRGDSRASSRPSARWPRSSRRARCSAACWRMCTHGSDGFRRPAGPLTI